MPSFAHRYLLYGLLTSKLSIATTTYDHCSNGPNYDCCYSKRSCVDTVQIDSSEWISKGNVCSLLIYSEGRDAANIRNGTHCLYLGS
jgi:hypothetical protein